MSEPPSPSAPNWSRVAEVFDAVASVEVTARPALLDAMTTGDAGLRREVEELLAALDRAPDALERRAVDVLTAPPPPPGPVAVLVEGTRLGPWLVVRRVAEGGMGTVYEATRADDAYEGRVAIKTLARGALDDASQRRFRQERQILATLQHPHIAALIDGGTTPEGLPYLVMEYVDGQPIDAWCDARHLSIAERLDLFRQVCDALQYAHRKLVVHRDLKPSNILVTADGTAKVVDFGIAKLLDEEGVGHGLTTDGMVPLTIAYASPEQARGDAITTSADVYSLGVVLHRLLAGGSPYAPGAASPIQLVNAILHQEPLAPSATATAAAATLRGLSGPRTLHDALERELDAIVLMALRKEPERRYPSVEALGDDVHRFLKGLPVTARPDTVSYRVRKFVQRQRALVAGVAVGATALAVGAGVALSERRQALAEAARSERVATFMQTVLGSGDARFGTGGIQVGPQASVDDLLAGATRRASREFADDPHVRGRLFTAIGSALITRTRMVQAAAVLDSAIALLRGTYGPDSPEYAFANLEASQAAVYRNRVADAERFVGEGLRAIGAANKVPEDLRLRAMRDQATVLVASGRMRKADTVVRRALAEEAARGGTPTVLRAALLNRLVNATAWLGGMRQADSVARLALAAYTAAGVGWTLEEADIVHNAAMAAIGIGQFARADSLCREGRLRVHAAAGVGAVQDALFEECFAVLASIRGDTAAARRGLLRALVGTDSMPDASALLRNELLVGLAQEAIVRGEWRRADSIAVVVDSMARLDGRWLLTMPAKLLRARTRGTLRDFATAERLFLEVTHLVDSTGLEYVGTTTVVRIDLARIYTLLGPREKADSLMRLLPPELRASVAPWAEWYRTHPGIPGTQP